VNVVDAMVLAVALRWVSDDQPAGWVEVSVKDADGADHRIIDKVVVLTQNDLTSASPYPTPIWIEANTETIDSETVEITLAHNVETTEGLSSIRVPAGSVELL
jgi:hypothetical protein